MGRDIAAFFAVKLRSTKEYSHAKMYFWLNSLWICQASPEIKNRTSKFQYPQYPLTHQTVRPSLQWALPHLRLRYTGFRKVRRQTCKQISRRARQLGPSGFDAYRIFLEEQPEILERVRQIMTTGGYLVLGQHGQLPKGLTGFSNWNEHLRIYKAV